MKWFKHQANARNDERLASLEDKCGLEGYGFYFKMLEIVAEVIDATDRHEVTYSLTRWGRQTNITSKKFLFLLQCAADVGLMIAQRVDDDIIVKIPNLLKYRDNHTKNLQVTCKQEIDKDIDKEVDKTKNKQKAKSATPPSIQFALPEWIDSQMWELWLKTRKGKKLIPEQMQAYVDKLARWRAEGKDYGKALADAAHAGWQGLFEPKPTMAGKESAGGNDVKEAARRRIFGGGENEAAGL